MRIAKITIKDFRAFAHVTEFDLQGGKNLLLYGENGSGKSSLFHALRELFGAGATTHPPEKLRNIFVGGTPGAPTATDGHVTVTFVDGSTQGWNHGANDARPAGQFFNEARMRSAFLDYRSLLRTNFDLKTPGERLFQLAVGSLLANVPLTGGGTVGSRWSAAKQAEPRRKTKRTERELAEAVKRFNDGVQGILPEVQGVMKKLLSFFVGHGLELTLDLPSVQYDWWPKSTRDRGFMNRRLLSGATQLSLDCEVKLNGVPLPEWNEFLNEARLSALALSMYLAGVHLSNLDKTGDPVRLLVFDDVLVGLDMVHRRPFLNLLEHSFARDWQIVLLTFDKAWYEVAKQKLDAASWSRSELYAVRVGNHEAPVVGADQDHLLRALAYLNYPPSGHAPDVKAAAVHVRTKFERVLKWACETFRLPVRYSSQPHKVSSSEFWNALRQGTFKRPRAPIVHMNTKTGKVANVEHVAPEDVSLVAPDLGGRVEQAVTRVLNPLSHSQDAAQYRQEIEDAIFAIDDLERSLRDVVREMDGHGQAELMKLVLALRALQAVQALAPGTAAAPAGDGKSGT